MTKINYLKKSKSHSGRSEYKNQINKINKLSDNYKEEDNINNSSIGTEYQHHLPPEEDKFYPTIIINRNVQGIFTYGFGTKSFVIETSRPELITELLVLKGMLIPGSLAYQQWVENPYQFMAQK